MIYSNNDNIGKRGFIDKNKILEYVTEEQIFELVFGFQPKEFDYVTSPFREDEDAGCWFEYSPSGKLKFVDFGSQIYIRDIKMINIDCFDAVQIYFKTKNLYETLEYIKSRLILGKDVELIPVKTKKRQTIRKKKKKVEIFIQTREFDGRDRQFWEKYGINRKQLVEDKVFAVKRFSMTNTRSGDIRVRTYDICYAYTNFKEGKKKLYRPYQKGKYKFLTNCGSNEIGGINSLPEKGTNLIISKSYKDYRVLKNQGLTVIWFQNEGMIPSKELLMDLCQRFTYITVFFDNDKTGVETSKKVAEVLNSYVPNKAGAMYLPIDLLVSGIKDPSDFIERYGQNKLKQFLSKRKLI